MGVNVVLIRRAWEKRWVDGSVWLSASRDGERRERRHETGLAYTVTFTAGWVAAYAGALLWGGRLVARWAAGRWIRQAVERRRGRMDGVLGVIQGGL